jgi:hypothetical protein
VRGHGGKGEYPALFAIEPQAQENREIKSLLVSLSPAKDDYNYLVSAAQPSAISLPTP